VVAARRTSLIVGGGGGGLASGGGGVSEAMHTVNCCHLYRLMDVSEFAVI